MRENFVKKIVISLLKQHRETFSKEVRNSAAMRKRIENNDPSIEKEIFENAVASIYTAGFSSEKAEKYSKSLIQHFGLDLLKIIRRGEDGLSKEIGMGNRKNKKVIELCKYIVNLRESNPFCSWVRKLHRGERVFNLGPKSDEDLLKGLGYFQHFPVDTLTARFFERVGLLKYAAAKYSVVINPLASDAVKQMREVMMKVYSEAGQITFQIDESEYLMRDNLGLADILVWLHCNENRKYQKDSVCRDKPLCQECQLESFCEYRAHLQRETVSRIANHYPKPSGDITRESLFSKACCVLNESAVLSRE